MKKLIGLLMLLALAVNAPAAEPLRVFIRAGVKTHGPNQHDHPRFLKEWTTLLGERGMKVEGGMEFPTAEQLEHTDVLILYAQNGMKVIGEQRASIEKFLKRGGGLVVIHDAVDGADQNEWAKKVQGGAWRWDGAKKTRWYEGDVGVYFVDTTHPITKGFSNFDWKDEIYYDLDMSPDVKVLATSFQSVFIIAPQLWTYEKTWEGGSAPYRAFVSLPGHEYDSFNTPHYRVILLRGIAWAAKRENVDEFCKPEEVSEMALRYPAGGPTRPEEAASKLVVHPDFSLKLVASEPLVEKVISLDWAPDGKMWVAETPEYPGGRTINPNDAPIFPNRASEARGREERPPHDRISWLEDTDGDGGMDRKHVFYEGLERVTSMVFYKDGVIVEQAPDILWLRDTDGDGKADKVEKLYTGFGTGDTHAVINNMRWGYDGWIYSAIGYSAGEPKTGDGSQSFGRVTAGIIRFKPDGTAVEQVASGSCNTWGFDFAPDTEMFYTTATCGEHLLHIVLPEKALARGSIGGGIRASAVIPDHQKVAPLVHHTRPAYMQIDYVGMFTASAGCCVYDGGAWPEPWNQMVFSQEPTVSLVHNDVVTPKGATFLARKEAGHEDTEFFAGKDLWFRPIHSRVGPDGALYVVDWYNQAVVHNDTRGPAHGAHNAATRPDRDHHFARIWRVQHKQAATLPIQALDTKNSATWINALSNPNAWLRMSAHRLLSERGGDGEVTALQDLLQNRQASAIGRMHALYVLGNLERLSANDLISAVSEKDPILRKNALKIVAERDNSTRVAREDLVKALVSDPDPRVQVDALVALATFQQSPETAQIIAAAWTGFHDPYIQSAAIGAASKDPLLFIQAAFGVQKPETVSDFVGHVTRVLANQRDGALVSRLVQTLSAQPESGDELKQVALESLAAYLRAGVDVAWDNALQTSFAALLKSKRPGVASAAVPLIARWDTSGTLSGEAKPLVGQLLDKLQDKNLPDEQRGQIALNLVGVHSLDASIIPKVGALLGSGSSPALQQKTIEALGTTGAKEVGDELIAAYPRVPAELRDAVFAQLIKRSEWTSALLKAMSDKKVDISLLGTANLHRLRTYADRTIADKANEIIDAIRGPQQKQKDTLIAQLKPAVEQAGGDVEGGHKLFTANCATCHSFRNEGRDLAPNLTGMGAHGPADLLVHIVDPNRLVEPNFYSASVETKDELSYDGIIARENNAELVLRNASGDFTIRKDNVKSRRSTGLSLMPEGFESLGGPGLRDLLAFLCAGDQRFRILNLTPAFTVNTGKGVYSGPENPTDAPEFRQHGLVKVDDIPFEIVSPQKAVLNAVVLKGGTAYAKTLPQKVEAPVGVAAQRLYFLSGIAGWGWPSGGDQTKSIPALKVTLHFAGGASEEMTFHNGVEFADWIGPVEVPGSKGVPELTRRGQVRMFSKEVKNRAVIEKVTMESFDNAVAPTVVGLTAELASPGEGRAGPARTSAKQGTVRTLIVGAGSSHDFNRWFLEKDSQTLRELNGVNVETTARPDDVEKYTDDLEVLYLSNNAPFTNPANRKRVMDFADSGKGLLLVHPALWYNWNDWPEYNRVLSGGGSRGHDPLNEFEVTVTEPGHPLMKGVPTKFTVRDELYWFQPDTNGTPIKVLATAHSPSKNKDFPMVFIVEHPKARIVGIALGHDGAAHDLPAYQQLLKNSFQWAARKDLGANVQ